MEKKQKNKIEKKAEIEKPKYPIPAEEVGQKFKIEEGYIYRTKILSKTEAIVCRYKTYALFSDEEKSKMNEYNKKNHQYKNLIHATKYEIEQNKGKRIAMKEAKKSAKAMAKAAKIENERAIKIAKIDQKYADRKARELAKVSKN